MKTRSIPKTTNRYGRRPPQGATLYSQLETLLSLNPHLAPFEDIAATVRELNPSKRAKLLSICEQAFADDALRKDESLRVACAKAIVALAPKSADSIKRWIRTTSGKNIREVHFSLFCFLDWVPGIPGSEEFTREIPALVEEYLLQARSDAGFATFMAGDLMGDHWEPKESMPVLMRVAREARYVAGRDGAIHGLSSLLRRMPSSNTTKASVLALLRDMAEHDRSESVRVSAQMLLETHAR